MTVAEQRRMALQRANRRRLDAAALRKELMAGTITLSAALDDPRADCMPVGRLLCSQRGWGPTKANRLLSKHGIWPTRRVGDLTVRQQTIIASASRSVSP